PFLFLNNDQSGIFALLRKQFESHYLILLRKPNHDQMVFRSSAASILHCLSSRVLVNYSQSHRNILAPLLNKKVDSLPYCMLFLNFSAVLPFFHTKRYHSHLTDDSRNETRMRLSLSHPTHVHESIPSPYPETLHASRGVWPFQQSQNHNQFPHLEQAGKSMDTTNASLNLLSLQK